MDAFRRTLLGDRNDKEELLSEEESLARPIPRTSVNYAFAQNWDRILQDISGWNMCGQSFGAYMAAAYVASPSLPPKRSAASRAAWKRLLNVASRYLTTTRRGYFEIAPYREINQSMSGVQSVPCSVDSEYSSRQGDLICVAHGCTMPLVVRPYLDGYQLIGECYVQGLMNGEVEQFVLSGEAKVEENVFYWEILTISF